jgi:hypothetical protein
VSTNSAGDAIDLFFSYSHRDEALRDELAKQLKLLERQGAIRSWHDRAIGAGSEWRHVIDERLMKARVILLLISADFLASDYCFDLEMKAAMRRHDRKEAAVVPIILRPVEWETSPFGRLQVLPRDGKPITTYSNQDTAFKEVALGIRALVDDLRPNDPRSTATPAAPHRVDEIGEAENILPVSATSPLLLGLAIDISGSMQESVRNPAGPDENRLQAVLQSLKRLSGAGADWRQDPQLAGAMDLVKVFAYGFGFANRAADLGALASLAGRWLPSMPPPPAAVHRGEVRDLLEIAGLGQCAVPLKVLGERWSQVEERLWDQRFDLFGKTPMRRAMIAVRDRFHEEFRAYRGVPRSLLIVVSDGESTDGSPVDDCRSIEGHGTTIGGAYLTSNDISTTRKLYEAAPAGWPSGACTLFQMCSVIGEDGPSLGALRSQGWNVTANSRLFLQLNQSDVLSEFVEAVVGAETMKSVG